MRVRNRPSESARQRDGKARKRLSSESGRFGVTEGC